MKFHRKLIFGVLALLVSACGNGGSGGQPNQADVNAATEDFTSTATFIFDDFDGVVTCDDFNAVLALITGDPAACDSGSVTVSVTDSNCNGFPAEATLSFVADNCQDNAFGTLADGSIQIELDLNGDGSGDLNLSSSGIIVNNINFEFDNLLVTISPSGNVVCTGEMQADGDTCTVASDCASCAF